MNETNESLPQGWVWATVGHCFQEIRNGTTFKQNRQSQGLPVSRIETLQKGTLDLQRLGHIQGAPTELVETFKYLPGDIVFNHINSYEHVGKTAIYLGSPETLIHGMNLLRLRLGHSYIFPKCIYFIMQGDHFRDQVRSLVSHAVNQVSINQRSLSRILIPIPPLPEQHRIVAEIEKQFTGWTPA